MTTTQPLKRCSKCGEEKELTEFYKDKSRNDGLEYICKSCGKEKSAKYYINNNETVDARNKKYVKEHPDKMREYSAKSYIKHQKKRIAYSAKYRKENPDKVREHDAKYYIEHKDEIIEYNKKWIKTPKGKLANSRRSSKYRSLHAQVKNDLTLEQWETILKTQKNKCAICGKSFCKSRPPTKDHIIPVSKGGGLTFENVQALCQSCNSAKSNKIDYSVIVSYGVYS